MTPMIYKKNNKTAETPIQLDAIENIELIGSDDFDDCCDDIGFKIITSSGNHISLQIDTGTNCCEEFNAILVLNGEEFTHYTLNNKGEDIFDEHKNDIMFERIQALIGAKISKISFDDNPDYKNDDYDDKHMTSIDVQTDRGTINLVVYNFHNGYYPHEYVAIYEQKQYSGEL